MPKHACLLIPAVLVAFLWEVFSAAPLFAKDVRISGDFEYTNATSETTENGEKISESEFSNFSQLYTLDFSRRIFPYLNFNAGGIFEKETAESETENLNGPQSSEIDQKVVRPYMELLLNNPLYRAGLGYRQTDIETDTESTTGGSTESRNVEEYSARLGWRPADFPQVDMNFTHTNISRENPDSDDTDNVTDDFNLKSRYEYKDFFFNYFFTHRDFRDEISGNERLTTSHNGTVQYTRNFLDNRIALDAGMRLFKTDVELSGIGAEQLLRTSPLGNVFLLAFDPIPEDDPPAEVADFEPLGEATINQNEEISLRLDFDIPTELDTITIPLISPTAVSAPTFNVTIYTSDDRENWTETETFLSVTPISEGFQEVLQITLSDAIRTRYLKILLENSSDQAVQVVGLQAFTTISNDFSSFEQNYNLGLSWRISDRTFSRYDFYYQNRSSEPGGRERTLLTNSVNLSHTFNRIFSASTRLLRSDSTDEEEKETGYDYSASLRGDYLDTFRQTLTYSGSNVRTEEGTSTSDSILLRNVADLYLDWSAFLDVGYSWNDPLEGGETTSRFVRAGTHLQPHRKTDINLDYTIVWSSREDGRDSRRDTGSLRFLFVPVRTVSLFAGLTYVAEEDDDSVLLQDYNIGWSPFPDGTLQFSFGYNTSLLRDGEEETYSALMRWQVARGIFLDLNYSLGTSERATRVTDFNSYTAKLRLTF